MNTAIDSDDGNCVLRTRAERALRSWNARLVSYVEEAKKQKAARPEVNSKAVATLIIASLEGALMMSRIQRSDEPLRCLQSHLNDYLDTKVSRLGGAAGRVDASDR